MNVATAYPARRQPDGTTWYRAAEHDGTLGMGWTSDLVRAHPDYRAEDAPEPLAHSPLLTSLEMIVRPPTADEVGIMAAVGEAFDAAEIYHQPPQPKETTVTDIDLPDDITEIEVPQRCTQWMRYPLPPATPRPPSKFNGWKQYVLPSPTTGRPTGFPRATTIAKTLDETSNLAKWGRRETVARIVKLQLMNTGGGPSPVVYTNDEGLRYTAAGLLDQVDLGMAGSKVSQFDAALDLVDNCMGGADARELGECVHAWLEALDMGLVLLRDVPEVVRPHVHYARKVLASRGLICPPQYVERTVLNDQGTETVAGKIDRLFYDVTNDELVLGDVKTSKVSSFGYAWLTHAVQIGGVYGYSRWMLNDAGDGWDRMPKLPGIPHPDDHGGGCPLEDKELWGGDVCPRCGSHADDRAPYAILLHVPSDQPERAAAITIDMQWGAEVMAESLAVRNYRSNAKKEVPAHTLPVPSTEALRYTAARMALSEITSLDEGQAVYETYQDVWNDDLGEFAATVAGLL